MTFCLGTVLSHLPKAISVRPVVSGFGGTGYISAASYGESKGNGREAVGGESTATGLREFVSLPYFPFIRFHVTAVDAT